MAHERCRHNGNQLLICPAHDTIGGQRLDIRERIAKGTKRTARASKSDEHGGLPDSTLLSVGMNVVVTFNVEIDLDIANRARGEIVKIVLDDREPHFLPTDPIVQLTFPPTYVLIKMISIKVARLEGLEQNVIPLVPTEYRLYAHRRSAVSTEYR